MPSGIASRIDAVRMLGALLGDRRPLRPPRQKSSGSNRAISVSPRTSPTAFVRHLTRVDRAVARQRESRSSGSRPPPRRCAHRRLPAALHPFGPAYAAVSASVDLARALARERPVFVNWLLRRVGPAELAPPVREEFGDDAAWLAALHSFPVWLVRRWLGRLGKEETGGCLQP